MSTLKVFVAILVLTGVFFMFRPAGLQLGSGIYFSGSFGSDDTSSAVSAPSFVLDFEIRSVIELEDRTLVIEPAAIVLVDGSSKTASRGRTGFWPWQLWRSYVAINKSTTMYAEFHTVDMRPDFISATTDAVQGFSNVNFTSSLIARPSSYLEGIRLAYYPADVTFFDILARSTDPVLGQYEGEAGVEFYNIFVLKKLNPGFNSVTMHTDVRRPIAILKDARISYHYSEVKVIEDQ